MPRGRKKKEITPIVEPVTEQSTVIDDFTPSLSLDSAKSKTKLTADELEALAKKKLAEKEKNRLWRRWRNGAW